MTAQHETSSNWEQLFDLIEELSTVQAVDIESRLEELRARGEPEELLNRLRIHMRIPASKQEIETDTVVGGEYRIVGQIGSGGMGVVYEAVLEKTGQTVALKVIHPDLVLHDSRPRFLHEMKALGRLDHPGIVRILHAGSHTSNQSGSSTEYFTMDRIAGTSLREYLRGSEATLNERLRIIRDIAIAVQYAHDRDVIHRDLKPGNIIVRSDGRAMVLDFGLASAVFLEPEDGPTRSVEGTPPYMAPEQAGGENPTPAVDVYSLGAILYEMLTGEPIFRLDPAATFTERLETIRNPPPRRAVELPDGPSAVAGIIDRSLALSPEDRFSSAAAMARALNRHLPAHYVHDPPHRWHPVPGGVIPATDWVLEERLGDGAHGEVWLGRNRPQSTRQEAPLIPRPRVYKFCGSEQQARALRREVRVFQALLTAAKGTRTQRTTDPDSPARRSALVDELPGILPIEAWSLDEPPYYISMPYLEGVCDLAAWSAAHEPSEEECLSVICTVATALQFSHEIGILHRDVKPANILVGGAPGTPDAVRAWLVDFGLAAFDDTLWKSILARSLSSRTEFDRLAGTPDYIAPEVRRHGVPTVRSDLYSAGVVLYRLLRGDMNASLNEWKEHIADPFLREDLERCLADDPEDRFPSANDFRESLLALPSRRAAAEEEAHREEKAEEERQAELAAAARAAFRRGVIRTSAVAAAVIIVIGALAFVASVESGRAKRASAHASLRQAQSIADFGTSAGRREEGLDALAAAALLKDQHVEIRSRAAQLMALPDLTVMELSPAETLSSPPSEAVSSDHRWRALAKTENNVEATLELRDLSNNDGFTIKRGQFPWIPIPEEGLFQFNKDATLLACAGPETSMQMVVADVAAQKLQSYLYTKDTLRCFAWHPTDPVIATGHTEAQVRLWDLERASVPRASSEEADLPPELNLPALDAPSSTLKGHRGAILALAFHESGDLLASLDSTGRVRLWKNPDAATLRGLQEPKLLAELDLPLGPISRPARFLFEGDDVLVQAADGRQLRIDWSPSPLFHERRVGLDLKELAWNGTGNQLCVITSQDILWLDSSSLQTLSRAPGKVPESVTWIAGANAWAVPNGEEFVSYSVPGSEAGIPSKIHRWKPEPAKKGMGAVMSVVSNKMGRLAVYFGQRVQFSDRGAPPAGHSFVASTDGPPFRGIEWDPTGEILTLLFRGEDGTIQAESWSSGTPVAPLSTHETGATRVVRHPISKELICRSEQKGIFSLNIETGVETGPLDYSPIARQDAPLAVSPDGNWIAAAADFGTIRLLRGDGLHYADLASPRPTKARALAWSPDGTALAAISQDGHIQIWSLREWRSWINTHLND